MAKQELKAAMDRHGITIDSKFIPWSLSRNAGERQPSLNWKVTLKYKGKAILTSDYGAGMGHAPSYKQLLSKVNYEMLETVRAECETGFPHEYKDYLCAPKKRNNAKPILPDAADVLYSLLSDAETINYATYEDFAAEFGYDEDSRSGEHTYRACLEIALKMRAALGEAVLDELRTAAEGY